MSDIITYERHDGHAKWICNVLTREFIHLRLPFYFKDAPEDVRHDLIEHIRKVACMELPRDAPLPDNVRAFRDLPETKKLRGIITIKQSSMEKWC